MSEELILNCPHCPQEKSPKLYINPELGLFNCFRCGFKGRVDKLKKYPELLSTIEDSILLANINKLAKRKEANVKYDILEELNPVSTVDYKDIYYNYLIENRGWSDEMVDIYCPLKSLNPKFKDRVILPIFNPSDEKELIYFTARSITNNVKQKYINAKTTKDNIIFKSQIPDNILSPSDCVITEGIFDAAKIPNAISLLGKIVAEGQKDVLFSAIKSFKNIYISLDFGTKKESLDLYSLLSSWFPYKHIFIINENCYNNKDLGELSLEFSPSELLSFIKNNSKLHTTPSLADKLKTKLKLVSSLN